MLNRLHLKNVGPAPEMKLDFGKRLNLITGDNGLGKSFLLDVAWWALTRRWPHDLNHKMTSGYAVRPREIRKPATIEFDVDTKSKSISYISTYVPRDESWTGKAGRPWNPGLVIYAHADGSFSVWDPARNYWKRRGNADIQDRLPGFAFSPKEVWDGLRVEFEGKEVFVCNGLIHDWANWIREGKEKHRLMEGTLALLSPSEDPQDVLSPGPLSRISINDSRDVPTIKTAYSDEVPILWASAGVRRIVSLAYMLVWSATENALAASNLGEERTGQVVLLVDELESHLHPRWQRSILRALIRLMTSMHLQAHLKSQIQIIAVTHSPLIMASAEPTFDDESDAWFDLDLQPDKPKPVVELRKRQFVRRGDVSDWLTSEAFDLKEPRSLEAEEAMTKALELLRHPAPELSEIDKVHMLLQASLCDTDRFWVRWCEFRDARRTNETENSSRTATRLSRRMDQ